MQNELHTALLLLISLIAYSTSHRLVMQSKEISSNVRSVEVVEMKRKSALCLDNFFISIRNQTCASNIH